MSRRFSIYVQGRPAPQGSKKLGAEGQMLEQAGAYLPAWRNAVKRACFQFYADHGIEPARLPLYGDGPVVVSIGFYLAGRLHVNYPPDLDKLARSTFDALKMGRVYADDARVRRTFLAKDPVDPDHPMGAFIMVERMRELSPPESRVSGVRRLVVARLGRRSWGAL